MAEPPSDQDSVTGSTASAVVRLRADLIRTAVRTAQVMQEVAVSRERAAASYRQMARPGKPFHLRYLQHALELDLAAARARRFAEHEMDQVAAWQQEDHNRQAPG